MGPDAASEDELIRRDGIQPILLVGRDVIADESEKRRTVSMLAKPLFKNGARRFVASESAAAVGRSVCFLATTLLRAILASIR